MWWLGSKVGPPTRLAHGSGAAMCMAGCPPTPLAPTRHFAAAPEWCGAAADLNACSQCVFWHWHPLLTGVAVAMCVKLPGNPHTVGPVLPTRTRVCVDQTRCITFLRRRTVKLRCGPTYLLGSTFFGTCIEVFPLNNFCSAKSQVSTRGANVRRPTTTLLLLSAAGSGWLRQLR